jgi:hypothetical protein
VLFFFTDNSTVEAALYKGNSKSRKLFNLVVKLRKLQLSSGVRFVVSHVSGKRMIEQGTDGVSRGCMKEGVAASGQGMLTYIPLHLSATQRNPGLTTWLRTWIRTPFEILTPEGWYERGHGLCGGYRDELNFWYGIKKPGTFIWCPPHAAAEVAMEELRKAVIKRQDSTHVIICPCLLAPEWRKQLNKASDIVFTLDAGHDEEAWPLAMHEPLMIGFVFPFLNFKPWQRRGTPKMLYMGRKLSSLQEETHMATRDLLRQFFAEQQQLTSIPEHVVQNLLYFANGD